MRRGQALLIVVAVPIFVVCVVALLIERLMWSRR